MNTIQELVEPLEWLLPRIAEADLRADGKCHPSLRRLAVQVLERCLIDADWLTAYSGVLKRMFGEVPRHNGVLEGKSLKELSEDGLRTLGDGELIRLALDPVTLWALYYRLRRCARSKEFRYWMELVEKVQTAHPDARVGPDAPLPAWDQAAVNASQPREVAACPAAEGQGEQLESRSKVDAAALHSGEAVRLFIWSDGYKAWFAVLRPELFRPVVMMSDSAGDLQAVLESPLPVRESCPWAEALQIRRSGSHLTVEAVGREQAGSACNLKVWVADRPDQAESLSENCPIAFLDAGDGEPSLLLAVEHREEPS